VGTIFGDREKLLSGNGHDPLDLFESELTGDASGGETELPAADTYDASSARLPVRSTSNAAFVAGLVTALALFWAAGQFADVFTPEHLTSRPFDGQLPPLPPSPWASTHVELAALQPAMLAAMEFSSKTFAPATTTPPVVDGSLVVESNPDGADVFIDGARVGTTPLVLANQHQGRRAVRIEAKGHEPWTAAVQIVSGQEVALRADLNLTQSTAEPVVVESQPAEGTPLAVTAANPIPR
jgi:hypothetical protein